MSEQKMIMVALALITPSKFNPRKTFDKKALEELQADIEVHGIMSPITVRPLGKGYEIIYGERRYRAALALEFEEIQALVRDVGDKEALEMQISENQQRADLHPLEEAEGYELLMKKHKETVEEIAAKVGKSKGYVYQRMALCALAPECRKMFYDGKLTAATALLIARMPKDLQKKAAEEIQGDQWDGPMSLERARDHIRDEYMLELKDAPWAKNEGLLLAGKISCADCQKRTGNQDLLFSDIKKGDRCTDPSCFAMKRDAYGKRQLEEAKKSGQQVLKTEDVFSVDSYNDGPAHGYVMASEVCYSDPKRRTYAQIIAKSKKKPSLVADKKGRVCEVIKKSDAMSAAKEAGIPMENRNGSSKDPAALAKQKVEERVNETKRVFWVGKVSTTTDKRVLDVIILDRLLDDIGMIAADEILQGKARQKNYGNSWHIPGLYELSDKEIHDLTVKAIQKKSASLDADDLEYLSGKLGFDVAKDYVITKEYLNAMTKEELEALNKEFGLNIVHAKGDFKKSDMVKVILEGAPKGKVPAELAPKAKGKGK